MSTKLQWQRRGKTLHIAYERINCSMFTEKSNMKMLLKICYMYIHISKEVRMGVFNGANVNCLSILATVGPFYIIQLLTLAMGFLYMDGNSFPTPIQVDKNIILYTIFNSIGLFFRYLSCPSIRQQMIYIFLIKVVVFLYLLIRELGTLKKENLVIKNNVFNMALKTIIL